MKKLILIIVFCIFFQVDWLMAADIVHDPILTTTTTIKTAIDKLYQAAHLDFKAEDIGLETKQLANLKQSLIQLQETYSKLTEVYDQAMYIKDNIGDPMKIAAFVNRNFTKNKDIDSLLTIADRCMNASMGDLNINYARGILDEADEIIGGDYHATEAKLEIEQRKREIAIQQTADHLIADVKNKFKDLYKGSQELNPNKSTLNEMLYSTYKTGEYQAGVFSQYLISDQIFKAMQSQRMYNDDAAKGKSLEIEAKMQIDREEAQKAASKASRKATSTSQIMELFSKGRAF